MYIHTSTLEIPTRKSGANKTEVTCIYLLDNY